MRSSPDRSIDLNADVGEGPDEEPLYALITSANIACGGHTGDEATMKEAVTRALHHGVAIGAHPSYPDRTGFGRVSMTLPPNDLRRTIAEQIEALMRVAGALGARVTHVKPHGALYNDAMRDREIAVAIAEGVRRVAQDLILVGLAGASALELWREFGLRTASEGFADRTYRADGSLVPRRETGALITDPGLAAAQAVRLAAVTRCDTICVHSDTPGAAAILAAVRSALKGAGFGLQGLTR